ncbi:D-alanyl-D-alanine carboxypeptidase-like protein [Archangium gephyra]|uniref:D-alanyl-D-alanine carboxypeptidase-like protein n=1 Tax=Archangium gephyra TaxID=48 RepID=A0AAC8Q732_9BACT|nr:D-alanyl-D-alanine carboxypeptidase family protein [Archangium gephyra]AKJ02084.1 mannose-binding lectin [Archangium gephyra]REG28985.1 D-alanyl-D-alanine carboxypeptidase-like protein [Archangium gephyra]
MSSSPSPGPRTWVATLSLVLSALALVALPATAHAAAGGAQLVSSERLNPGQALSAADGRYRLVMQSDGNLVYYQDGSARWQSGTGVANSWAIMQGDGNLVVYNPSNVALWQSGTGGNSGAFLALQDDGNVVIYNATATRALWQTSTVVLPPRISNGQVLYSGTSVRSEDGRHRLVMQSDGNLVFYRGGVAKWSSGTASPGARAVMQADGNLVVYNPSNVALWQSGTGGNTGAFLAVQDDGNVVIYNAAATRALWQTNTVLYASRLNPGETLGSARELRSPDEKHRLVMQADGNLVVYSPTGAARWWTGTSSSSARAVMQADGNLVVYNSSNVALWQSGTSGYSGAWLALQNDGNLVIYDASGTARWWIGGYSPPTVPTSCSAVTSPVGSDQTVLAEGFRVHKCAADAVGRMIRDARAAGISLTGWGWRSVESQIQLRREHCGTSYYAIYEMPSSQCSPPTARPGYSQHERGLALDFASMSSSSSGFAWLRANAARYGFYNLPSESWHWSTTGL